LVTLISRPERCVACAKAYRAQRAMPLRGEHRHLDGKPVVVVAVHEAAGAGVLALGVLPDEQHVDLGRSAVGQRALDARQQPHRPQVHVQLERRAQRHQAARE